MGGLPEGHPLRQLRRHLLGESLPVLSVDYEATLVALYPAVLVFASATGVLELAVAVLSA